MSKSNIVKPAGRGANTSRGEYRSVERTSVQPKAKQALHAIRQAETRADAEKAFDPFIKTYEPKYPKAALCLHQDHEELIAFYDFPARH